MHYFKTEFPSNLPYLSFHDPPHHLKKNYEDPSQTGVMMKTMHYFHLFSAEIPQPIYLRKHFYQIWSLQKKMATHFRIYPTTQKKTPCTTHCTTSNSTRVPKTTPGCSLVFQTCILCPLDVFEQVISHHHLRRHWDTWRGKKKFMSWKGPKKYGESSVKCRETLSVEVGMIRKFHHQLKHADYIPSWERTYPGSWGPFELMKFLFFLMGYVSFLVNSQYSYQEGFFQF